MTTAEAIDVRHFLREDETLGTGNIELLEEVVGVPQLSEVRQELREMQSEIEAGNDSQSLLLRSGLAAYVLGQHKTAVESLSRVPESATGSFFHALVLLVQGQHEEAEEKFQEAAKFGYDKVECVLRHAGAMAPTPAFKIGELVNDPLAMYLTDIYTISANLAGLPAISIPAGLSSTGLPIGLQLIGPAMEEEKLLQAARMFERETDWHKKQPNMI